MTTIIDAKRWLFDQVVTAKTMGKITITGNVFIDKRPGKGEDIVVGAIMSDSEFFQNTVLNVNCYVPDLQVNTGDKVMSVPDIDRLEDIAEEVYEVIKDVSSAQIYRSYVESMRQFEEEKEQSHYINFRVQMFAKNY